MAGNEIETRFRELVHCRLSLSESIRRESPLISERWRLDVRFRAGGETSVEMVCAQWSLL